MTTKSHKQNIISILLLILTFFFTELPAATSADYNYSHRKRDCEITLLASGGEPLGGTLVGITLIRNDFAFGGTIQGKGFDSLGDDYGDKFRSYFDIAAPENEMTWEYVMRCSQKCDPDFSKADTLLAWLQEKKINVRGHNLFSNEKEERIPQWARDLGTEAFKQAMLQRIHTAMDHFKGKVEAWDLINEICHGDNGSFLSNSMLETRSGDPNILNWILDEARKRDSDAKFIINDYAVITSSDQTAADHYINKVKPMSSKFQIVGVKGHFGESMNRSSWEPKVNYIAQQLGKPVWLTEVDFSVNIDQVADKIEELMRACFANPKVGGLTIGNWCERFTPHEDLTSFFVDTLNTETPAGQRWREVRDEWKTTAAGYTDEFGKFKFNGFQGKYQILVSCYTDTFYLEPGEGTKNVDVIYLAGAAINKAVVSLKKTEFAINGQMVSITLPVQYNGQLFLSTWSLAGQLLSRFGIHPAGGKYLVPAVSSSCSVFRIETADRHSLFTGKLIPGH